MQTHATMYCKYYQLQVLYTLFSPILGQVQCVCVCVGGGGGAIERVLGGDDDD